MENTNNTFDIIESESGYKRVLDYIDLFDEGRFGADKLFLRGSFGTLEQVKNQIDAFLHMGADAEHPIPSDAETTEQFAACPFSDPRNAREIADVNRLFDPNRKIWKLSNPINDFYPQKADYRLLFFVKLHFNLDFAYIWFGIRWNDNNLPATPGETAPTDNISDYNLSDLELLKHVWINREDAELVLAAIKGERDTASTYINALSGLTGIEVTA